MASSAAAERPQSPSSSANGDIILRNDGQQVSPSAICTHPRSVRIVPNTDKTLVSPALEEGESSKRVDLSSQDQYGDPSIYQTAQSQFYPLQQPTHVRPIQYHAKPVAMGERGIRTRSGREIASPTTSASSDFSPRSRTARLKKAPRNAKTNKTKGPHIDVPLSIMTKDYRIPVKDMGAWVHRSAEDRMKEVEKKKGYISRPMNSFMLYRSAYAERVKQFCKENNHQIVSQVTGASWPLEPKAIRDLYEDYANIERDNHHAAHPEYKFAPNKGGKKRQQLEEDSDDDAEWEGSTRSNKRGRVGRSESSTPFEMESVPRHQIPHYIPTFHHPSSYQAINPHGPSPMTMNHNNLAGQYYQRTILPYGQHVDDVKFEKVNEPFPSYDISGPLIGLPSGSDHDLLTLHQPFGHFDGQVDTLDPQLANFDPNIPFMTYESIEPAYELAPTYGYGPYQGQEQMSYPEEGLLYHPGLTTLTDGHQIWTEQGNVGSDFDSEFQRWN